ncbi:MAG: tetratricopeptide repeat protein, partial [Planctomycetaceae bacterium]
MKIRLLAAAVCATVCTGCNTANLLSSRLGQGHEEKFSQFAETADGADSGTPRLPPPTNRDPRPSVELTNTVDEHVRLGETELRDQRLTQAQSHFEQALIAQPQHAKANHRMGVVCDKLGQYERAEKHYLLALQHDPRNVAVLSDLGYSYWLQKRYAESERHLLEARSIDPNYETAVANLGMLYGTTGRTDEALVLFRQIGDETQVQQIMQQVTALAARDHAPAQSAGPMTPAALAANIPTEKTNPFEATRDLSGVNAPTRELLELMEQGRRQQQRPESVQQASWTPQAEPPSAPAVPPFAQQRPAAPQPRPPQMAGVNPFHNPSPAVRPTGPAQVPNHLLNQALSQLDREG